MNVNKHEYGECESVTVGLVPTVYNYIEYYYK
jgi:hypothetical protein